MAGLQVNFVAIPTGCSHAIRSAGSWDPLGRSPDLCPGLSVQPVEGVPIMRRVLVSVALCALGAVVFAAPVSETAPAADKEYTLLVSSTRTGNPEIFLVNPTWGDARNLTRNKADDGFPAWSPDGKKIAFVSDRDGRPNIYVMDADGKSVKQLTTE